jgi:branched-chain amino acid transport system substrate-binding protein
LLAISDYVTGRKVPILSLAAAEDLTQRKPNPYFVRASATSAQAMHPLADFAVKELKYKTVITISDDFAFGYEQMGGFQRVFEDDGGRITKKLRPPIVIPDYTPYLAQLGAVDAVVQGFAGANPGKFMQQYKDAGLKLALLGGEGAGDDALLKSFGDEAVGLISASPYSADFDSPSNKKLVAEMLRDNGNLPGVAAAGLYINGMVAEAALQRTGGKTDDKDALIKALRAVSLTDSPRGPFHFDRLGNVVGNIFVPERTSRVADPRQETDIPSGRGILGDRPTNPHEMITVAPGDSWGWCGLVPNQGPKRRPPTARDRYSLAAA